MEYERDHDVLTEFFITAAHSNVWRWRCWPEGRRRRAGALVMLDLDNLKYINDTYGHDMGDAYTAVYGREPSQPRRGNAALWHACPAMSSSCCSTVMTHRKKCGQIALAAPAYDAGFRLRCPTACASRCGASGGVAWYPADSDRFDELVRYADFAMYQVKNSGKGEFAEFDGEAYRRDAYLVQSRGVLHRLLEQRLVDYHLSSPS